MMNLQNMTKNRSYGAIVTLAVAALSIIAGIVYFASYHNVPRFLSVPAVVLMIVGGVVGALCLLPNIKILNEVAPAVIAVCNLAGLCLFIQAIYNYVMIVAVGIDVDTFDPEFIVSTVFIALAFVGSIAAIFCKQNKENN